jgi:hypothetical protein
VRTSLIIVGLLMLVAGLGVALSWFAWRGTGKR